MNVSIIIPAVIVDEETFEMTNRCIYSFEASKGVNDEIVLVIDAEQKGNAWAWNEGARRARKEVLLFSDNDIIAEDWRQPMLHMLQEGHTVVFPSVFNEKIWEEQTDHLAGECWMISAADFSKIGGIDEMYISYWEDTDFFVRVNKVGGTLAIARKAHVRHKSQGTFRKIMPQEKIDALYERNKLIYKAKHFPQSPHLANPILD